MKIAFATANLGIHGVATFTLNLSQWLQSTGHDVTVLTVGQGEWWARLQELELKGHYEGLPLVLLEAQATEILGDSYFRVFDWQGYTYAMARLGVLYRAKDGLTNFEEGPNPLVLGSAPATVRHVALKLDGDLLSVYYSRIGDNPEQILLSTITLTPDWRDWQASAAVAILAPTLAYEGAALPSAPSVEGMVREPVHQLRDPAIFRQAGRDYLLYTVAGESGIAIAELVGGR